MIDIVGAAGLGLGLGVVTGMPLGVVNVAIIDAATRRRTRFAIGIGIGGALADLVHAAIAFIGVGRIIHEHPSWTQAMAITAAIAILGYALFGRRTSQLPTTRGRGVVTGLLLTLPNPAALGAWIAVAAALWPAIAVVPALVLAFGVGVGSAVWFVLLARWIATLPADHRVTRIVPQLATVLLVALAVVGIVRAV